jgi:hypothetical protein
MAGGGRTQVPGFMVHLVTVLFLHAISFSYSFALDMNVLTGDRDATKHFWSMNMQFHTTQTILRRARRLFSGVGFSAITSFEQPRRTSSISACFHLTFYLAAISAVSGGNKASVRLMG